MVALLTLEGASRVALWAADLRYVPVPETALSARHREIVQALLDDRPSLLRHDPTTGWSLRPGYRSSRGAINSQGLRAGHDYPLTPDPARRRVAAFGDSATFGDEVGDDESYPAYLEELAPELEVLNFGVPGFGPDQAWLRYRAEGARLHPRVVVIGFLAENIYRVVSVFRPFYHPQTGLPMAKPRFVFDPGGELRLVPNPLPARDDYRALLERPAATLARLARDDHHAGRGLRTGPFDRLAAVRLGKLALARWRPDRTIEADGRYVVDSEAFALTVAILEGFYREIGADGATAWIAVLPTTADIARRWRGEPSRYQPLVDELEARGLRLVDVGPAFDAARDGPLDAVARFHYTARGNRLVAAYLLRYLGEE